MAGVKKILDRLGLGRGVKNRVKKLIISALTFILVMATFGTAIWLINLEGTITGQVVSVDEGDLSYTGDFAFGVLNTTNGLATKQQIITIRQNIINNGDENVFGNYSETLIFNDADIGDNCDPINDCSSVTAFEGTEINEGDIINLTQGNTELYVNVTCKRFSCPQDIVGNWSIEILP